MCGLVGVAGDITPKMEKVFKQLLVLDSLRGEDSTGAAFIGKYKVGNTVAKQVGDPFNLLGDGRFTAGINKMNRVIIGHNRYATIGGVSRQTAHPFDFDTLVGAHNGTLGSKHKLLNHLDFKVDSQALYHHIEVAGLQNAIDCLGGDMNAWALTWWNKEEDTLNFLRNKERPLFLCTTADSKTMFWASEPWMLESVLGRNEVKYTQIELLPVDMHLSLVVKENGDMEKAVMRRVAAPIPYVAPYVPAARPPHIPNKQVGNVHQLPNKTTVVEELKEKKQQGSGSVCDASYLSRKNVSFEILAYHTDSHGSKYLSLFDPLQPYKAIRVYPRKQDDMLFEMVGEEITGDVGTFDHIDKFSTCGYYKISPDTVKLIVPAIEHEERYPDHTGRLLLKKEWLDKYVSCEWCSDILNPQDANRFTTSGQCVCQGCSKNPEVKEYVNLI